MEGIYLPKCGMRTGLAQSSVLDGPEHPRSVMDPGVMMAPLLAQVLLTLALWGWVAYAALA